MATTWRYAVRNRDNSVVTHDLPHVSGGTCQHRGNDGNVYPPSMAIGNARVPLIPPQADALPHEDWPSVDIAAIYALLDQRQRVERYVRGRPWSASTAYVVGDTVEVASIDYICISGHTNHTPPNVTYWALLLPEWSGNVDGLPMDSKTFSLSAADSLSLAQEDHTMRQDYVKDTASNIFASVLKHWDLTYGDDFATLNLIRTDGSGLPYVQITDDGGTPPDPASTTIGITPTSDPNSRVWVAASTNGMTGVEITNLTPAIRYFFHNDTPHLNPLFIPAVLDADFIITADANAKVVSGGLVFGYAVHGVGSAPNRNFSAEFAVDVTAGPGNLATAFVVLNENAFPRLRVPLPAGVIASDGSLTWHAQIRIYSKTLGVQMVINGQDVPGAIFLAADADGAIGAVGFYALNSYSVIGGSVFASNLYFFSKTQSFLQGGTFEVTTAITEQTFDETADLDVMTAMAGSTGKQFRKNCGIGWGQDSIDFGASLGTDSGAVFDGTNIVTGQVTSQTDKFASEIQYAGKSTGASPITYYARSLAALKKYGLVSRKESNPDVQDFYSLRRIGQALISVAGRPGRAKTITVDRTGLPPIRELDYVMVVAPHLGLNNVSCQVMGWDEKEGSPVVTYYLDHYPARFAQRAIQQIRKLIGALTAGATQYSTTVTVPGVSQTSSGIVVNSNTDGSPPI